MLLPYEMNLELARIINDRIEKANKKIENKRK